MSIAAAYYFPAVILNKTDNWRINLYGMRVKKKKKKKKEGGRERKRKKDEQKTTTHVQRAGANVNH